MPSNLDSVSITEVEYLRTVAGRAGHGAARKAPVTKLSSPTMEIVGSFCNFLSFLFHRPERRLIGARVYSANPLGKFNATVIN